MKMSEVPEQEWKYMNSSGGSNPVIRVMHNDKFLVQIRKQGTVLRLSINKKKHSFRDGKPIWKDGITWDELQDIKNACGFEDQWLCEYYPPKDELVNVANIRHLWVMDAPPIEKLN